MESFLVRLWQPVEAEPLDSELRGTVRRIGGGDDQVFASGPELLELLRAGASGGAALGAGSGEGAQRDDPG